MAKWGDLYGEGSTIRDTQMKWSSATVSENGGESRFSEYVK